MTQRDRKTYIGSSDARDILNGNWNELFLLKTGRKEPVDLSDQFNVQMGLYTETFHIDWTIRRMIEAGEIAGEQPNSRQVEKSPKPIDYVACHIDAALISKAIPYPLEVKHSSGARSMEELVDFYMPQLQHQLWCCGADKLVFSVIQGNKEPERVWIGRSEDYIKIYAGACIKFWKHVETDTAPRLTEPLPITPEITDAISIDGMTRRCADGDNEFISRAVEMQENEAAARTYENAKKDLKAMVGPTEREVYSDLVTLTRDKRGAIRFKWKKEN